MLVAHGRFQFVIVNIQPISLPSAVPHFPSVISCPWFAHWFTYSHKMSQEICRSSVLLWLLLFKAVSISSVKSIHAEISIIVLWLWVNLDQWIMIHLQRFACHDLLIKKIMIALLNINNHETRTSVNFLHCSLTMGESWWVKNSQHTTFKTTFKNPGFAQSSKITWQIHQFDELNVCYHRVRN